jgi:hypothetical protein
MPDPEKFASLSVEDQVHQTAPSLIFVESVGTK